MSNLSRGSPAEPQAELLVVVEDAVDLSAVIERLGAAGMSVTEAHEATGVVTGSAPASTVETLRKVDGVSEVELSRDVQLPPPDSPIQ